MNSHTPPTSSTPSTTPQAPATSNAKKVQKAYDPIISVKDVWKAYGTHQVLRGLSLDVHPGETVVILGRSGAGKSVLLKQIIGLDTPDRGSVMVQGQSIVSMPIQNRIESGVHIGMLFQNAALFDSMTVGENTGFYLTQHPDHVTGQWLTPEEIQKRVKHALELVGLQGTEQRMPSDLSGGMKRRAALARLIVYQPTILLYDEPTAGLDPVTAMQINELIVLTQHELNATSIVVTHDLRSAIEVGDRLALHHEGKLALILPTEAFFASDNPLVKVFIANTIVPEEYLEKRSLNA